MTISLPSNMTSTSTSSSSPNLASPASSPSSPSTKPGEPLSKAEAKSQEDGESHGPSSPLEAARAAFAAFSRSQDSAQDFQIISIPYGNIRTLDVANYIADAYEVKDPLFFSFSGNSIRITGRRDLNFALHKRLSSFIFPDSASHQGDLELHSSWIYSSSNQPQYSPETGHVYQFRLISVRFQTDLSKADEMKHLTELARGLGLPDSTRIERETRGKLPVDSFLFSSPSISSRLLCLLQEHSRVRPDINSLWARNFCIWCGDILTSSQRHQCPKADDGLKPKPPIRRRSRSTATRAKEAKEGPGPSDDCAKVGEPANEEERGRERQRRTSPIPAASSPSASKLNPLAQEPSSTNPKSSRSGALKQATPSSNHAPSRDPAQRQQKK